MTRRELLAAGIGALFGGYRPWVHRPSGIWVKRGITFRNLLVGCWVSLTPTQIKGQWSEEYVAHCRRIEQREKRRKGT